MDEIRSIDDPPRPRPPLPQCGCFRDEVEGRQSLQRRRVAIKNWHQHGMAYVVKVEFQWKQCQKHGCNKEQFKREPNSKKQEQTKITMLNISYSSTTCPFPRAKLVEKHNLHKYTEKK
ncbi:hypothetical protein OPV22_019307 [Ensete ventricosum]|uniref:Zinc-binding domain-containing protein n=1 Tax=Ensete ventricosum TaxID=4639 RepID=A0AAV8P979_ENSVE|nr:hypothetical protein OPV22_019307 [Ensete ventricosum]